MTKPTRLFLTCAGGILVIGLGAGAAASYYLGGLQGLALIGTNGPDELRYVPGDVRLLAFVNVREVMDSDVRKALRLAMPSPPAESSGRPAEPGEPGRRRGWQTEVGLDPERDIDQVVVWSSGADRQPPLVLARGRFDETRIEGSIRESGGTVDTYVGTRLVVFEGGAMAIAFIEPGLVAAGPPAAIKRTLDARRGTNVTTNTDIMRLVREAQPGSAWAVGHFDALTAQGRLPDGVARRLPPITWVSATAHLNGGVEGTLRAEARDDAGAKDLRDVLQGFMALARLQSGPNAGRVAAALNDVHLSGTGKSVLLQFTVPAELVGQLAAMRPRGTTRNPAAVPPARATP